MLTHFSSDELTANTSSPVVIFGNFDGVHLGHQELIRRAQKKVKEIQGSCIVYTFYPHPAKILAPKHPPKLLQNLEQKLSCLNKAGVDICIVESFTENFSHMSAEIFLKDIVVNRIRARTIVIGYDFTFGIHREGTSDTLTTFAKAHNIDVDKVEAQFQGETLISSTNIRNMIADGDIEMANSLLGRPYSIEGRVISGRGLGGALNAHTANIDSFNELIPLNGVYISETKVGGSAIYPSVTSIGDNPTFPDSSFAIETHLLDVEMDLLGKELEVAFLKRLREQVCFKTQADLKERIKMDIVESKRFHQSR